MMSKNLSRGEIVGGSLSRDAENPQDAESSIQPIYPQSLSTFLPT